jgi:hypothetical protein
LLLFRSPIFKVWGYLVILSQCNDHEVKKKQILSFALPPSIFLLP